MNREKVKALKRIVEQVCNISLDVRTRKRKNINARAIAYKILRDTEYMSYHFIGREFNKSHATVIYSVKEFPYLILSDRQMERDYNEILSIWNQEAGDYKELTPLKIKKDLKDLFEENKLLNLSIINVQKECDAQIIRLEVKLKQLLNKCQE
jgi:hypothetical protein